MQDARRSPAESNYCQAYNSLLYALSAYKPLHANNKTCEDEDGFDDIPDSFEGCFALYDEMGEPAGNTDCLSCHLRTACMAMSEGAAC